MSKAVFPLRISEAEAREYFVRFVGGSTAVTKVYGVGVSVTYVSTGIVDITWAEDPGNYLGTVYGLEATAQAALKTYVVVGSYTVTGTGAATVRKLRINITAGGTLTDLAAAQWISISAKFKETSV